MQEEKKVIIDVGGSRLLVPLSSIQSIVEMFMGAEQVNYRYHDSEYHYYVSAEPFSISVMPLAQPLPTKAEVDAMIEDREAKKQALKDLAEHAQFMRNLETATPDAKAQIQTPHIDVEAPDAFI